MLRSSKVKVTCFYCNQASFISKPAPGPTRKFECPRCDATNYLDQKGEIIDFVPTTPPEPPVRYGFKRNSPMANALRQDGPLVCRFCQTNHTIIATKLSDYLPDESDPNYEYLWEHANEYKRRLEEQYPPLCLECAPKVDERIRSANYMAKTQGLSRLLENTRQRMKSQPRPEGLGNLALNFLMVFVWYIWGIAYWATVALFMLWQVTTSVDPSPLEASRPIENVGWDTCLRGTWKTGLITNSCQVASSRWVNYIMPWALLLFFRNYKWMELRRRPGSYMEGWYAYLFCQGAVASFIAFNWWLLSTNGPAKDPATILACTSACLILELLVMWQAISCLKVARPAPTISLREVRPLTPDPQSLSPKGNSQGMRFQPTGPLFRETTSFQSSSQNNLPNSQGQQYRPSSSSNNAASSRIGSSFGQSFGSSFGSQNGSNSPAHYPIHQQTGLISSQSDPDAMEWAPEPTWDTTSFSQPRQSGGNVSDDEDDKTEFNGSPLKNAQMRPKTLLIDGAYDSRTGLESLFAVAAKLDEATPMKQPALVAKRTQRYAPEIFRGLGVFAGLFILASFEGVTAVAGLGVACLLGTMWRFILAVFKVQRRPQTNSEILRRCISIAICLGEFVGTLVVSAQKLGYGIPVLLIQNSESRNPLLEDTPLVTDATESLTLATESEANGVVASVAIEHARLTQITMRALFVVLALHQAYDFGRATPYRGKLVKKPKEPSLKRKNPGDWNFRDVGAFTTVNATANNRSPSPVNSHIPQPSSFSSQASGFGGTAPLSTLSHRSNFSSWTPQATSQGSGLNNDHLKTARDVGIRKPSPQPFGSSTGQTMKVPPSGLPTQQNPWSNGRQQFQSSSFQQPRGTGTWGL
ncbi:hypothetical protein ABW19_dt0201267 [Dactylella cylindrospora]|nr:hypothetical protein ABW19_dt0201267 [Dactylella cylindrospora]